jgi:hypothetical protein
VLIWESTPFLRDKVEKMDTKLSSLMKVVAAEAPLGGTKRHHETNTSDRDKELRSCAFQFTIS